MANTRGNSRAAKIKTRSVANREKKKSREKRKSVAKPSKQKSSNQESVAEPVKVQPDTEGASVILIRPLTEINNHLMSLCRLCETDEGPFWYIFDTEQGTAKEIKYLMPFEIAENDNLPQRICFRCTSKVGETYEFIQKCVKSQQNFRIAVDKQCSQVPKASENKVNFSDVSNGNICDVIKTIDVLKALNGTKDTPSQTNIYTQTSLLTEIKTEPSDDSLNTRNETTKSFVVSPANNTNMKSNKNIETVSKVLRLQLERCDDIVQDKILTRTNFNKKIQNKSDFKMNRQVSTCTQTNSAPNDNLENNCQKSTVSPRSLNINKGEPSKSVTNEMNSDGEKSKHAEKIFDIMEYVSALKFDNVGTVYLCNLCKRYFMTPSAVKLHECAQAGVPRFTETLIMPASPKPTVVKYINTKSSERALVSKNKSAGTKIQSETVAASKVNREPNITNPTVRNKAEVVSPLTINQDSHLNTVPNRTLTLVEELEKKVVHSKTPMKRQAGDELQKFVGAQSKQRKGVCGNNSSEISIRSAKLRDKTPGTEMIQLENQSTTRQQVYPTRPYPVGVFPTMPPGPLNPPIFATTALQNESYSIVKTEIPGKLLISTKPQPTAEAVLTKRIRKSKHIEETSTEPNQPYSVTQEDSATYKNPKFFQSINVNPLLQSSYVLPTGNIKEEPVFSHGSFIEE